MNQQNVFAATLGAVAGATILAVILATTPSETGLYAPTLTKSFSNVNLAFPHNNILRRPAYHQHTTVIQTPSKANKGSDSVVEVLQEVTWKHLQWAFVCFIGLAATMNGIFLTYWKRKEISVAAFSGQKDEEMGFSRRHALLGASGVVGLTSSSPAYALFGFGEDDNKIYAEDTTKVLDEIKSVLVLDAEDPSKPEKISDLRRDMNSWVAKYRRDSRFSGRASFGNLYSVINAIAGHYTNFGIKAPIPKKRAAQIVTEIGLAEQLVSKGR